MVDHILDAGLLEVFPSLDIYRHEVPVKLNGYHRCDVGAASVVLRDVFINVGDYSTTNGSEYENDSDLSCYSTGGSGYSTATSSPIDDGFSDCIAWAFEEALTRQCDSCDHRDSCHSLHQLACSHYICRHCLIRSVACGANQVAWAGKRIYLASLQLFDVSRDDYAVTMEEKTEVITQLWATFGWACCGEIYPFGHFLQQHGHHCMGAEWSAALERDWHYVLRSIESHGHRILARSKGDFVHEQGVSAEKAIPQSLWSEPDSQAGEITELYAQELYAQEGYSSQASRSSSPAQIQALCKGTGNKLHSMSLTNRNEVSSHTSNGVARHKVEPPVAKFDLLGGVRNILGWLPGFEYLREPTSSAESSRSDISTNPKV